MTKSVSQFYFIFSWNMEESILFFLFLIFFCGECLKHIASAWHSAHWNSAWTQWQAHTQKACESLAAPLPAHWTAFISQRFAARVCHSWLPALASAGPRIWTKGGARWGEGQLGKALRLSIPLSLLRSPLCNGHLTALPLAPKERRRGWEKNFSPSLKVWRARCRGEGGCELREHKGICWSGRGCLLQANGDDDIRCWFK
jgi:hypothetical protein